MGSRWGCYPVMFFHCKHELQCFYHLRKLKSILEGNERVGIEIVCKAKI